MDIPYVMEDIMKINGNNKNRYTKKILVKITKYYFIEWLIYSSVLKNYHFNVNDAVSRMSSLKMEQIKQCVLENAYFHSNLWFIYEEIKGFKKITDLLLYLAPNYNSSPETVLLDLIRSSNRVRIVNTDNPDIYRIYPIDYSKTFTSKEDIVGAFKTFMRSYVLFIFDIEKVPRSLTELYQFFLNEQKPYSSARHYKVIELLIKDNYTVKELLNLACEDMTNPEYFFKDVIKHDYNHFFRMIDDYYGSKEWTLEDEIKAYIKLYDIYSHGNKSEKTEELGSFILENLNKGSFGERFKRSIRRIILRNRERGNYGI